MGKGREPVAEIDDATDIAIGAFFVPVGGYVIIEFFELSLGKRCENYLHWSSPPLPFGAVTFDVRENCIARDTL
jgi:hypothetical protein